MAKCNANLDRLRGHKIKLYPTDEQKAMINKVINIYRAVYNIGLDMQTTNYKNGKKYIQYYQMCKVFSNMRNNDPDYQWLNEITMSTIRQALVNLDHAFKNFFNKVFLYPKFKSKKHSRKSFMVRSDRVYIRDDRYIQVPDIGIIYTKYHQIPLGSRVYNASIVFDGYDYWFTCQYEREFINMDNIPKSEPIGVDVGIRNLITTSNGEFYKLSDTRKYEKRLKRQQRRLQKSYDHYIAESMRTKTKYEDVPKSKNMQKRLNKRFKTIQKIRNKRKNDIHTATKRIVDSNPSAIVIEDIRTKDLIHTTPWIRKYKPCFGMIHDILKYKAEDRNIPIIIANHNYPSSQICSRCGNKRKVYHETYKCNVCGLKIDRDLNAAINLRNLAYQNCINYICEVV